MHVAIYLINIDPLSKKSMKGDFLRERALKFLENGKYLFSKGIYDLSAFNIEQFCQLILKYKISELVGDYPKTHSMKKLFDALLKITEKREEIESFVRENISVIGNIENAYVSSRYLPSTFRKEEIEDMLRFAERLKDLLGKI